MLAVYGLGQVAPDSCNTDNDCPSGSTCNAVTAFCEPMGPTNVASSPQPTSPQITPAPGVTCGTGAIWQPATQSCVCPVSAPIWDPNAQACTSGGASPGMQLSPVPQPAGVITTPAIAAGLPLGGNTLLWLLAIAVAAGGGYYVYRRVKRNR